MSDRGPDNITRQDFSRLILDRVPVIDVRAPIEFGAGRIPGAVNLPVLDDSDRHRVGLTYKHSGPEAAIKLGEKLVSGEIRDQRTLAWKMYLENHPSAVLTCFRGGLRSQTTQNWLRENGIDRPLIHGGYKAVRRFLMNEIDRLSKRPMLLIGGATGAGKSIVLGQVADVCAHVDLEGLARHRGSAFGGLDENQPTQIDFENTLAADLIRMERTIGPLLLEDESLLVGRVAIPPHFFARMRESPIVVIEDDLETRVDHTFDIYIKSLDDLALARAIARSHVALKNIARKLGGVRFAEAKADLERATAQTKSHGDRSAHRVWIEKILAWYYDPLYLQSLARRAPHVEFSGPRARVLEYLRDRSTRE